MTGLCPADRMTPGPLFSTEMCLYGEAIAGIARHRNEIARNRKTNPSAGGVQLTTRVSPGTIRLSPYILGMKLMGVEVLRLAPLAQDFACGLSPQRTKSASAGDPEARAAFTPATRLKMNREGWGYSALTSSEWPKYARRTCSLLKSVALGPSRVMRPTSITYP